MAFAAEALLVRGALVVGGAADRMAADQGVAGEAGLAEADGMVVVDVTVGIGAAVARTDAQLVDAGLGQRAVGVAGTADGQLGGCGRGNGWGLVLCSV